jgi:hypothetical protein
VAVALGTDTDFTPVGAGTSFTFSHVVAAGTDCLVVRIGGWLNAGQASGVTYGGVAMTNVGRANNATGNDHGEIWRLLAPTSGTANVVATLSVSVDGHLINATNLSSVDQTTPTGTFASATGSTGNPSVAAAGATGDLVLDAMGADASTGGTNVVGAGQTSQQSGTRNGEFAAFSSEAGAASVTMSWTRSTNSTWAIGAVAFLQSGGAPADSFPAGYRLGRQQPPNKSTLFAR